jgi:hypothetical protein
VAGPALGRGAMTSTQPLRQNWAGHPCPPWCVTDHTELHRVHLGTAAGIDTPRVLARPVHTGSEDDEPQVVVSGGSWPTGLDLFVAADYAGELAGLLEFLAVATPDQHQQLAAAIRATAASITGAGER